MKKRSGRGRKPLSRAESLKMYFADERGSVYGLSDICDNPYDDNHFIVWNCLSGQTVLFIHKVDSRMDDKGTGRRIGTTFSKNGLSCKRDKPFFVYSFQSIENLIAVISRYMG